MLCKIAGRLQTAEAVVWRSIDGEAPQPENGPRGQRAPAGSGHANATGASAHYAAPPADLVQVAGLQRRLKESESVRQMEAAQARQSGFEDGLRKGREESSDEVQKTLDQLARTIAELSQQKKKLRREAERELVKLSLAVARRILHRELLADPESIQAIVYAALQKLQNREISRVRVYPGGAAAVRAAMERIGHRNVVEVVADPMLATGGIFFETALGELDASIETQLQEIERGFADRLALA
jgi:flagellar assembly protein FliH